MLKDSGMTEEENVCMTYILECYESFMSLPRQGDKEVEEFVEAMHRIQGLLAFRVVQRDYPDFWAEYQ